MGKQLEDDGAPLLLIHHLNQNARPPWHQSPSWATLLSHFFCDWKQANTSRNHKIQIPGFNLESPQLQSDLICIVRNKSWRRQLRDKTLCFPALDKFKHVEQISFGTASHLANIGSWKDGSPTSNPRRLKTQSRQFFIASQFFSMETWGRLLQDATTNRNFPVTGMSMSCLDRARIGYRKFTAKNHSNPSLIHNSQGNNSPLPTLWCLHELNVFAKTKSRNGFLKQTCRRNLPLAVQHILGTWAAQGLAAPLPPHCC